MRHKLIIGLLGVLTALLAGPASAADTWALLVGISRYQSPHVTSLRFPAADALGLRDALIDPQLGGLSREHVRALVDDEATASGIVGAVESYLRPNVRPGDRVIIFLAGHGVAKGVGAGALSFLLPADVRGLTTAALESSAVDLKALSDRLAQLPASQFILFVDACREDPTPGRGIKNNALSDVLSHAATVIPAGTSGTATAVTFFACDVGQRSFEDPTLQHGVFTHWILEGIRAGAVAQPPDGSVDMSRLAVFVRERVEDWARRESASGDLEIEQTPIMVAAEVHGPVVLLQVKRWLPAASRPAGWGPEPTSGTLLIRTLPTGAAVSVDGQALGTSPIRTTVAPGEHTVRVEAAGHRSVERRLRVLGSCQEQALVRLDPTVDADSASGAAALVWFQRAAEAEVREQWEVAEAGYLAALDADSTMSAAHERLADLYSRQGRLGDAVVQLRALVAASPRSAHAHTLLARGCVALAADPSLDAKPGPRANGDGATTDAPSAAPRTQAEARALGLIAAIDATKADPNSAEAALALGFALVAADPDGSNRRSSLAAFGKSVLLSPQSADAHLGLGYGLRFFAQFEPSADQRRSELRRAVLSLKSALEIRPSDYQALRELAYCYHQLTDGDNARHVYEMAIAHRGAAPRDAEVAGLYLALADVLIQQSERLQGVARQHCVEAARAYAATAQEITPHLEDASSCLSAAGLSLNPALLQLGNTSGEAVATVPDGRAAVPAPPEEGPQATPRAEKSARAIDVDSFDLSAFPKSPTNFEEQQVMEAIRSASIAAFKADAHARLGRYYERRGDARRAEAERAKAEYWRTAAR